MSKAMLTITPDGGIFSPFQLRGFNKYGDDTLVSHFKAMQIAYAAAHGRVSEALSEIFHKYGDEKRFGHVVKLLYKPGKWLCLPVSMLMMLSKGNEELCEALRKCAIEALSSENAPDKKDIPGSRADHLQDRYKTSLPKSNSRLLMCTLAGWATKKGAPERGDESADGILRALASILSAFFPKYDPIVRSHVKNGCFRIVPSISTAIQMLCFVAVPAEIGSILIAEAVVGMGTGTRGVYVGGHWWPGKQILTSCVAQGVFTTADTVDDALERTAFCGPAYCI